VDSPRIASSAPRAERMVCGHTFRFAMPGRATAQRSTARSDAVGEACLPATGLCCPTLRPVLAQGTRQAQATRHRKMKRAIVHLELRSSTVGRSCETLLGVLHHPSGEQATLPALPAGPSRPGDRPCQSPRHPPLCTWRSVCGRACHHPAHAVALGRLALDAWPPGWPGDP
jgi:hypothetical protein